MSNLSNASRLVATDLRRAERSINLATRDTAQFLLTTLEVTESEQLSPAIAHPTVRATVDALTALVNSQRHMALRAHVTAERAGVQLGLTITNWGVGYPKPPSAAEVRSSTVHRQCDGRRSDSTDCVHDSVTA